MARVLRVGRLSDVAGWRERDIDSDSLGALRDMLASEDEGLAQALAAPGVQIALDQAGKTRTDHDASRLRALVKECEDLQLQHDALSKTATATGKPIT